MYLIGKHGEPIYLSDNENGIVTIDIVRDDGLSRGELRGSLKDAIEHMLKRGCTQPNK